MRVKMKRVWFYVIYDKYKLNMENIFEEKKYVAHTTLVDTNRFNCSQALYTNTKNATRGII